MVLIITRTGKAAPRATVGQRRACLTQVRLSHIADLLNFHHTTSFRFTGVDRGALELFLLSIPQL